MDGGEKMDKFEFLRKELDELKEKGTYNTIRVLESAQGPWVTINGRKMLNLCANNYLGLSEMRR
jgi:2-amino-3-ketobutyrate coenzyme A ligase (EC 2.3.1.29)